MEESRLAMGVVAPTWQLASGSGRSHLALVQRLPCPFESRLAMGVVTPTWLLAIWLGRFHLALVQQEQHLRQVLAAGCR